ncbi:MAG: hypothetical protein M1812_006353 [Candelaria pacifica]|nr:MAG: hypothetical protein M1812_006353 [Candelaria pacifica]
MGKKGQASNKFTICDYLDGIDPRHVTDMGLWPVGVFRSIHGYNRSLTGGAFSMKTMFGHDGRYLAKIIDGQNVAVTGLTVPPTIDDAIAALKSYHGC